MGSDNYRITLILGLFDRSSAIAGMVLIAMFWLANPPLTRLDFGVPHEGNYLVVDKNLVEFFALLILFLFPTGRYIGLGVFLKKKKPGIIPAEGNENKSLLPEPETREENGKARTS